MNFFLILLSLFVEKYRPPRLQSQIFSTYTRFLSYLDELLNSGEHHHGVVAWFVSVLPVLLGYNLLGYLLHQLGLHVQGLIDLCVLIVVIDFRSTLKPLIEANQTIRQRGSESWDVESGNRHDNYSQAIAQAIETAIERIHYHLLGMLFWYALLPGVNGVLLYVCSSLLNNYWGQDKQTDFGYFSRSMAYWLNWPVFYLTALTFAIVGNFEDAIYCWRTQGIKHDEPVGPRIVFASAAGALGIRLGDRSSAQRLINGLDLGMGDAPDFDHLKSTEGLIWRATLVWLVLFAFMAVATHV